MQRVSWTVSAETSPRLRPFAYLTTGVFGSLFVLLLVVLLALIVQSVVGSGPDVDGGRMGAFVLVLLIGSPTLVLFVWLWRSDREWGPASVSLPGWLEWRGVALASVVCAVAFPFLGPVLLWVVVPVAGVLGFASFEGELDPDAHTLAYHGRTVPVDAVGSVSSVSLGPVTVFRVRYASDTDSVFPPHLLFVPRAVADRLEAALSASARSEVPESDRRDVTRAERVVLAGLGLGSGVFGLFVLSLDAVPSTFGLYAAVVFGLLGGLMCWLAVRRR